MVYGFKFGDLVKHWKLYRKNVEWYNNGNLLVRISLMDYELWVFRKSMIECDCQKCHLKQYKPTLINVLDPIVIMYNNIISYLNEHQV